jgi:hypothetical protein
MLIKAKIMRPLIIFILLPVAIVGVICYGVRQNKIAQASAQAEQWKQQHTLTPSEENAVLEKLAANAAHTDLELWEMNHPDWKTGNALIDADTERSKSNSFYYEDLEKIKQIPTK